MKREPVWLVPDPWELDAEQAEIQRRRQYQADYRERNRGRINASKREWMRAYRAQPWKGAIGSLHSLSCKGPHRRNRPDCHPIPVYPRPEA